MSVPDLPEIIDIHTHFMPQRVLDKVWAYFDSAGPLIGRPWPITYREDEGGRLAALRALGVRAFTSLNYAHRPAMAQWLNDWSSEFAAKHDDVLHSATFYPSPVPRTTRRPRSRRVRGSSRRTCRSVTTRWPTRSWTTCGRCWSAAAPRSSCTRATARHPAASRGRSPSGTCCSATRVSCSSSPHMGMPDYGDFLDICAEHPDVHLDTTMAFTDFTQATSPFPRERMDDLVALGDRVLFGSDFPNIPYPYEHAVDAVRRLGLGEDWERKALHDNAARLFGIR